MTTAPLDRQPREHAVACAICRTPTWNIDAVCDNCAHLERLR